MSAYESILSTDYMPHGYCFLWAPEILWLHVLSDALIALSYFSIPISLMVFLRKRDDIRFTSVFYLFSAFIFLCGVTHTFGIITIWEGTYGLSGVSKMLTAIVSLATAIVIWRLIPTALRIPSRVQLEQEVEDRTRELEQKSRRLSLVIEKISPAIVGVDRAGKINLVNPGITAISGYSEDELLGKPFDVLLPERYRANSVDQRTSLLEDLKNRPQAKPRELFVVQRDGEAIPIELGVTLVEDDPDLNAIITIVDLSERLKLAAERRRLLAAIESCDDAIFTVDTQGIIQNWANGAVQLFGYQAENAIGMNIDTLFPDKVTPAVHDRLARVFAGETIRHIETQQQHEDGHQMDVSMTISPVKDPRGVVIAAAVVARDVSAQLATQRTLHSLNSKLAASNEALDRFVYIAAHDLREPLRGIHNLSTILQEDCYDKLDEEHQNDLSTIARLSRRMERLIDDLREYSRIDQRRRDDEQITVDEAVARIQEELAGWLSDRGATLRVDVASVKQTYPAVHLVTILRNLVTNAVKYNDNEEKQVVVSSILEDGHLRLTVADNGIGIAEAFRPHIYDMFKRNFADHEYGGGTGAGLAIVKRVVDYCRGAIDFETEVDKGTVFNVALPVSRPVQA